jgi:hypothetical protein
MTRRGAKANSANRKCLTLKSAQSIRCPDKLTQCKRENFSLISAANHSEWLRDPLDAVGDATGPLTGGIITWAIVPDIAQHFRLTKARVTSTCGDGHRMSRFSARYRP